MAAKVHEQAESHVGGFQVVQHLGRMLGRKLLDGLQFDNDLAVADEVRLVGLKERLTFVTKASSGWA